MPISYAERKKRRQTILEGLAPELQERLALRHVEAVAKLSLDAQRTLAMALSAGLQGIPAAIACLKETPQASLEEVLRAGMNGHREEMVSSALKSTLPYARANLDLDPEALAELSVLLQDCFPGMPEMTRQALAADDLLSGVLALVQAKQACFRSTAIQSELVFVALCGLALGFIDQLNRLVASRPHYRAALMQSGLLLTTQGKLYCQGPQGEGNQGSFNERSVAQKNGALQPVPDQGVH